MTDMVPAFALLEKQGGTLKLLRVYDDEQVARRDEQTLLGFGKECTIMETAGKFTRHIPIASETSQNPLLGPENPPDK